MIAGAVASPYQFSPGKSGLEEQVLTSQVDGLSRSYKGTSLLEILEAADPVEGADLVLLQASDGYAFFISFEELANNPAIVLQAQGKRDQMTFNVAGPLSKKAWVNGVEEIQVIQSLPLDILFQGENYPFNPSDWIEYMDSTFLDLGDGTAKYQGVSLADVIAGFAPGLERGEVLAEGNAGSQLSLSLEEVLRDDGIRIFVDLGSGQLVYALAHLDGEVLLTELESVQIQ